MGRSVADSSLASVSRVSRFLSATILGMRNSRNAASRVDRWGCSVPMKTNSCYVTMVSTVARCIHCFFANGPFVQNSAFTSTVTETQVVRRIPSNGKVLQNVWRGTRHTCSSSIVVSSRSVTSRLVVYVKSSPATTFAVYGTVVGLRHQHRWCQVLAGRGKRGHRRSRECTV